MGFMSRKLLFVVTPSILVLALCMTPSGAATQWTKARIIEAYLPKVEAVNVVGGAKIWKAYIRETSLLAGHASGKLHADLLAASGATKAWINAPRNTATKRENGLYSAANAAINRLDTVLRINQKLSKYVAGYTPPTTTTTVPPTTVPPPTTTTTSPGQYEAACTNSPEYGALTSPNAQTGVCVTYEAQVFQYDANTGTTEMLVEVTNDGYGVWQDLVELTLPQSVVSQNFIENDVIRFWGVTTTPDTYTTENNGTNTIPAVNVKYATLVSAASS